MWQDEKNSRFLLAGLYAMVMTSAASSIMYELLIAQAMASMTGNAVVWYSVTIGGYLAAMGAGSLWYRKIFPRQTVWPKMVRVELALAVLGAAAVPAVFLSNIIKTFVAANGFSVVSQDLFIGTAFMLIGLIGFLSGCEIPILLDGSKLLASKRSLVNRILSIDYLGSLVGAVALPVFLLPNISELAIGFLVALGNVAVGLGALLFGGWKIQRSLMIKTAAVGLLIAVGFVSNARMEQYFLKKYYYYSEFLGARDIRSILTPTKDVPDVERYRTPYQTIDLVKLKDFNIAYAVADAFTASSSSVQTDQPQFVSLFLNGEQQFFSNFTDIYHEYFAHVPIIANRKIPEKVLVIGGGDGLLAAELLKYPGVRNIDQVEIDPKMIELAKTHPFFLALNQDSFADERINIVTADGYQFLRDSRDQYDAIYVDLPAPLDHNVAKLYSTEFYSFARLRLAPDGFLSLDAPFGGEFKTGLDGTVRAGKSYWSKYASTLRAAGFKTLLPYATRLESDNQRAIEMVSGLVDQKEGAKLEFSGTEGKLALEQSKSGLLRQSIDDLTVEFIIAKPKNERLALAYESSGVALNVLNNRRYSLALSLPFPVLTEADQEKSNSIFRPTLPSVPFGYTRLPYL